MKLEDFPIADIYPFQKELRKDLSRKGNVITIKTEVGEISNNGTVITDTRIRKVSDREEFIKVFKKSIKEILKLSSTGQKVLWFIMDNLKQQSGLASINQTICMDSCGFKTRKSLRDGIIELLSKGIIIRSAHLNAYWVNPAFIFNGNRIEFKQCIELQE